MHATTLARPGDQPERNQHDNDSGHQQETIDRAGKTRGKITDAARGLIRKSRVHTRRTFRKVVAIKPHIPITASRHMPIAAAAGQSRVSRV